MVELNMEHVLILVIAVFLLYHLMNRCSCNNGMRSGNGFSVGGEILSNFKNCKTDAWREERFACSELEKQNSLINVLQHKVDKAVKEKKQYDDRINDLFQTNKGLEKKIRDIKETKCYRDGLCRIDPCFPAPAPAPPPIPCPPGESSKIKISNQLSLT